MSQPNKPAKEKMCVALATIGNNKPSRAILRACERANPHGAGIAWREGKRVQWEKGIDAEGVAEIMQEKEGPLLIHFRIATVGGVIPELCHPFPVGGNASLALSGNAGSVITHNGTWCNWRTTIERAAKAMSAKLPAGPFSDSRAMAWLVAQVGQNAFNSDQVSRFAHFTPKGIKLFGTWQKMNGFHASNLNWRHYLATPMPRREVEHDYICPARHSIYDQVCMELES